jgi:hypothetical protein
MFCDQWREAASTAPRHYSWNAYGVTSISPFMSGPWMPQMYL